MKCITHTAAAVVIGLASAAVAQQTGGGGSVGEGVPEFSVRAGYRVELAGEDYQHARFLQFGDDGVLYLSQSGPGNILALRDNDGDGFYETRATFIEGKPSAHSMDFYDGWLYFTQSSDGSTHKARDTDGDGIADELVVVLPPGSVPAGGGHPFRGIAIDDNHIYISVSDPSNMLDELPSERKAVYRFNHDGSGKMQFATGLRNTEKLRFRPGTSELWGCDHGSDWFGQPYGDRQGNQPITDQLPPEELNHIVEGGFYGHPYLVGNRIPRPEFASRPDLNELAAKTIPPAWSFGSHWAPNGHTFLTGDYFPNHNGDLFVAFHGSWNSVARVGYCVERVLFDEATGKPYGSLTVVHTISADGQEVLARPCDATEAPDGSVLFTCDHTQRIYRIVRDEAAR